MKKLLTLLLVTICFAASAQYTPNGTKPRWVYGVAMTPKDTASFTAPGDTSLVVMGLDSVVYYKHKGWWNAVGGGKAYYTIKQAEDSSYFTISSIDGLQVDTIKLQVNPSLSIASVARVSTDDGTGILGGPIRDSGILVLDTATIVATKPYIAGMLLGYAPMSSLANKVNYSDTASMLTNYLNGIIALNADTATIQPRLNNIVSLIPDVSGKMNYTDTTSMLSSYYNKTAIDNGFLPIGGGTITGTLWIDNKLFNKNQPGLNNSQAAYTNIATDTSFFGFANNKHIAAFNYGSAPSARTYNLPLASGTLALTSDVTTSGAGKVNISDTATMLSPYARTINIPSITGKLNISDTLTMLSPYLLSSNAASTYYLQSNPSGYITSAAVSGKLNISDTAAMLGNYYNKTVADARYVGLSNTQTITGSKTFTASNTFNNSVSGVAISAQTTNNNSVAAYNSSASFATILAQNQTSGKVIATRNTAGGADVFYVTSPGDVTANSFTKSGGTASQLLAANGTVITAGTGVTISGGTISASAGSGTVTDVSVTTANGISGTVATSTTTPAITLSLGAITPSSVNGVAISGSTTPTLAVNGTTSVSGTNTGDNAVNSLYSGLVSNATHTGDVTGATALTLATVNSNVGSFGSSTSVPTVTVNAKGLVTAASATAIPTANTTTTGLLSSTDWNTFNGKQGAITLTTTGNSGASTLLSNVLNIPNYTLAGLGGIGLTSLSATSPIFYNNTTGVISSQAATSLQNGYLTSTDWGTFNGKVSTIGVTTANGISGSSSGGTTPSLTLSLGAITPTSVNSVVLSGSTTPTLAVTGTSSISGSNTGDNAVNTLYSGLAASKVNVSDTAAMLAGYRTYYPRAAISLTTTGTSGAATYNNNTGVLNIPSYTGGGSTTLSGAVTGTGTGTIATTLANSVVGIANHSATGTPSATTYLRGDNTWSTPAGAGTVTNVSALTIGTSGTNITSTVANATSTPVITLNIPDASATARGVVTTGTQTFAGLKTVKGTTASDAATLGSETLTTATGTNWAGSGWVSGYTHTTGSTATLVGANALSIGTLYYLTVNITSATAGFISIKAGDIVIGNLFSVGSLSAGFVASTATALTIIPTTDFDGVLNASIKTINASSSTFTLNNSSNTSVIEMRGDNVGSTFLGINSGSKNISTSFNTSLGYGSLSNIASGSYNVALGTNSLLNAANPSNSIAIGDHALSTIDTTSLNSIAIGTYALGSNVTGVDNIAIGYQSGQTLTGGKNVVIGNNSGGSIGFLNTIVGYSSAISSTGSNTTAIGAQAFSSGSGDNNVAIGAYALPASTGTNNVAIGANAGASTSTTGLGSNTGSTNSIFIGQNASPNAISQTNQIVIGNGSYGLGSNTSVIGNSSTTRTKVFGSLEQTGVTSALTKVDASGKFVAAVSGTDYQAAISGTGFVKATGSTISYDNSTYQPLATNLTSIGALANGAGVLVNNGTGTFSYSTTPTLTGTNFTGVPYSGLTGTVPTWNQNTSGTASGLSATLVASSGGTGQSIYAVGDLLSANTTTTLSKIADVAAGQPLLSGGVSTLPAYAGYTLSGTAAQTYTFPSATKTLAANDGSNLTIASQAIGDILVASSTTAYGKLAAVATGKALISAGTNTAPAWGTVPTAAGGTNLTSFTSGGAMYATSSTALTTGTLPLTAGGTAATTASGALASIAAQAASTSTTALTAGATVTWTPVAGVSMYSLVPAQNEALNMGTVPAAMVGQVVYLKITTSGTTSFAVTPGTNILSATGALNTGTVTGKLFIIAFLINTTTSVVELYRTVAQ